MPRAIVTLRYQEELEPSEIASILETAAEHSKSRRDARSRSSAKKAGTLGRLKYEQAWMTN
jgi:hypothetical protein